jgi:uncharacterized protein YqeY
MPVRLEPTMTLSSRLEEDLKAAMRAREAVRRDTIRYLRSEVQKAEKAEQRDFDDDDVLRVLGRQAAQRRESIEAFVKGGRQDLVDKEEAELEIILEYMPEQMSEEQIVELVQAAIEEVGASGPQDMGKLMGRLMPQTRGKADGRTVNEIVRRLLTGPSDS